ncbi:MAG: hypothetical protein Q8L78_03415 [Coxiellaceae bacterium]|nr:hypothetical protein [Coxiellaceae bacterium]
MTGPDKATTDVMTTVPAVKELLKSGVEAARAKNAIELEEAKGHFKSASDAQKAVVANRAAKEPAAAPSELKKP